MRRVTSRQRLVPWDAFDAAADEADSLSSEYETCCEEGTLSRPSSSVSIVDLTSSSPSTSFDTSVCVEVECDLPLAPSPKSGRKRDRPSETTGNGATSRRATSSSNITRALEAPIMVLEYEFSMSTAIHPLDKYMIHELMDDVQLHIVSFLSAADARSMSATCHHFRHLLLSDDAHHLWKEWYHRQWPILSKLKDNVMTFRDALSVPTAVGSFQYNERDDTANLSVLLGLAAKTNPSKIDESQTESQIDFRRFSQNNLEVIQFTGAAGSGDRCIQSDQALPKPIREEDNTGNMSYLMSLLRRGARLNSPNRPMWRPFVAPYISLESAGKQHVHLTPRLVSYFEVSILERDESQEPPQHPADTVSSTGRRMGGTVAEADCVAIGVSSDVVFMDSKMPGWDSMSYGYHGDDGGIFHGSGDIIRRFGPSYGAGDTVGCGVDYARGGIFFTLNGECLGYGWKDVDPEYLQQNLYPTVGVDTNCPIACNFGDRPFAFDLTPFIERHMEVVECCLSPLIAGPPPSHRHRRPVLLRRST